MTKGIVLVFAILPLSGLLCAQEKPAAEPEPIHTVTLVVRRAGHNFPDKFTSYLHGLNSQVTMPVFMEETGAWIARLETSTGKKNGLPRFDLRITDLHQLAPQSGREAPFTRQPVEILRVSLPLKMGEETQVFKSKDLSLSLLFAP